LERKSEMKIGDFSSFRFRPTGMTLNRITPRCDFTEFKKEDINQSIFHRFQQQVALFPGKIAIKTESGSITYSELDNLSTRIAVELTGESSYFPRGAALLFEQGADMVASMLGALKGGHFYIPLDPSYPIKRLAYMIMDSNAAFLLTNDSNLALARELVANVPFPVQIIDISRLEGRGESSSEIKMPAVSIDPMQPAYVLYTSGSTGVPKGVVQCHRNVLHFIRVYTNNLHINPQDRLIMVCSYCFDAAVMDIYGALLNGATLYPFYLKEEGSLNRLARWFGDEKITIYHSTPTVFRYFTETLAEHDVLSPVRLVVMGGEAVFKEDVEKYKKHFPDDCIFINGLGPTESTVTLQYFIDKTVEFPGNSVPVGYPVEDTDILLMNENNEEVYVYNTGELYFKSDYLALGYLNNPVLTYERFIAHGSRVEFLSVKVKSVNPLDKHISPAFFNKRTVEGSWSLSLNTDILYKTGDLARRLPDGNIEYIGRVDSQVKIRGFRVEIGEIEALLSGYAGVKQAVVLAREDRSLQKYLCAYVVGDAEADELNLKKYLQAILPDYMIPSCFLFLEEMPVTPNGKINKTALPCPQWDSAGKCFQGPRDTVEESLTEIWSKVLAVEKNRLGIDDDFYHLGGHSLKAAVIASEIAKVFDVKIPLGELLRVLTIREVSLFIKKLKGMPGISMIPLTPVEEQEYYPISSAQKRMYILQQKDPAGTRYNMPSVYVIDGEVDSARFEGIFLRLIDRHEGLRTSFYMIGDDIVQKIDENVSFSLLYACGSEEEAKQQVNDFVRPFDLAEPPLLRMLLFRVSSHKHFLFMDIHHIVSDGLSMGIFVQEFETLYKGDVLQPLGVQYKDYVLWHHRVMSADEMKSQENFWLNYLANTDPTMISPDYNDRFLSLEGRRETREITPDVYERLIRFCATHKVTPHIFLITAFMVFLSQETGSRDIVLGLPVSLRSHSNLLQVMGIFLNLLPFRLSIDGSESFTRHVKRCKDRFIDVQNNSHFPYELLYQNWRKERKSQSTDLFSILFNYLPGREREHLALPGLHLYPAEEMNIRPRYDLAVYVVEKQGVFSLTFEYKSNMYSETTIQRLLEDYAGLIEGLLERDSDKIDMPVGEVNFYSEEGALAFQGDYSDLLC